MKHLSGALYCIQSQPKGSQFEEVETAQMLKMKVVEPAEAYLAALIILYLKRAHFSAFCPLQKPSIIVIRHSYPIRKTNECIDLLG